MPTIIYILSYTHFPNRKFHRTQFMSAVNIKRVLFSIRQLIESVPNTVYAKTRSNGVCYLPCSVTVVILNILYITLCPAKN